ncbi:MAG TPA: hypothetical protein VGJ28_14375 [Micromonosporaceae bacterium]
MTDSVTDDATASAGGPYFEDLTVGTVWRTGFGTTVTSGLAATHQAIVGDRLALTVDEDLAGRIAGGVLAHPALIWDLAIGQSTVVTQRVVANLFYRGLVFRRLPRIGATLTTRTEVVALRQNRSRPSGLAALRITTTDGSGATVLDFWRCAMLPLRDPQAETGHADDLEAVGTDIDPATVDAVAATLDLSTFPIVGAAFEPGRETVVAGGDVVSNGPELARLTLNIAAIHHDRFAQTDGRLVYGAHVVDIAAAQLCRAFPRVVTILGWHSCDHLAPTREGDTLTSTIRVESTRSAGTGTIADLHIRVTARGDGPDPSPHPVADWRPIILSV